MFFVYKINLFLIAKLKTQKNRRQKVIVYPEESGKSNVTCIIMFCDHGLVLYFLIVLDF